MYKVKVFTTHRGRYRVIARDNDDDTFTIAMMDTFPVELHTYPDKEKLYLDYHADGMLGIAARAMLRVGEFKGITPDAKEFVTQAFNQEKMQ